MKLLLREVGMVQNRVSSAVEKEENQTKKEQRFD